MPDEIRPEHDQPDPLLALSETERLQTDRAHRDARRTFFVEGVRNVVQAVENGCEFLFFSGPSWPKKDPNE